MSNVLEFRAAPKQVKRNYKQCTYTVTYVPSTKQWKWDVEITTITKYGEVAESQVKAFRAAERHIDRVKKLQGVG